MISYEPKAIGKGDPEAIHDIRVSARRLQVLLKLLKEHDSKNICKSALASIRDILKSMGPVREHDVFLESLQIDLKRSKGDTMALQLLKAQQERLRDDTRKKMIQVYKKHKGDLRRSIERLL